MWTITYDRHRKYLIHKTSVFETNSFILAWFVYQWWALCYIMSALPVKQVSLLKSENGILYLKGKRGMSLNPEQLRRLKCGQKSHYYN